MKKDKYKKNNKSQGTPVNKKGAKINKTQIKSNNKLLEKNKSHSTKKEKINKDYKDTKENNKKINITVNDKENKQSNIKLAKKEYKTDCVVIGGGASGMMASIVAARAGVAVTVLEHTKRLGNKLLQTGNGKCNFTNLDMSKDKFLNNDKDFVWQVINKFDVEAVLSFFEEIGIYHKSKNGYIYPHSETAASLQEALKLALDKEKVTVHEAFEIANIEYNNDCYTIKGTKKVENNDGELYQDYIIKAKSVIIATGSCASPKTGSDGSGYELAKMLGHTVKTPLPALVQLISDNPFCKTMSGVRSTGNVKLIVDGNIISQDTGEIQYTDYGISGIPVFQISRYAIESVYNKKEVNVIIDMLPDFEYDELCEIVLKSVESAKNKTVEQFFAGLLNKKLVIAVAKTIGLNSDDKICTLKDKDIKNMLNNFKKFNIHITGYKDYANAQVCQGGVPLDEIEASTMQSKLSNHLYFAGEITDVDGMCGGYNLQWAWSSGYLAGKSAAESIFNNRK